MNLKEKLAHAVLVGVIGVSSTSLGATDPAPSNPQLAAQALIFDLRDRKPQEAFSKLGPKMQAAITGEALVGAWAQASGSLGDFEGLDLEQSFKKGGFQAVIFNARFHLGALQVTTAVEPKSLKVEGFFMKLVPAAPGPLAADAGSVETAFTAIEVKLGHAPFELGGTLTLPKKGAAPYRAVVLVQGSGPSDRDETIAANKPFKDLAEGLAAAGIATLRYDKRTFSYGKDYVGKPITMNEEVIDDALSAVELLAARSDIDQKKIFVVGHSLGALLAPEIGSKSKLVVGVVCLAPPARKPWDILTQQFEYLGAPPEKIAEMKRDLNDIRSGKAKGVVMGAPVAYWKEWASKDGVAMAKKLKKPVLVLRGSRDYQVIEEDFAAWKKGLAGVPGAEVIELPNLNHLFIEGEGKSLPAEYARAGHVAPVVLEQLTRFVNRP